MAVFRIEKNKDYTAMSNNHFKEKRMSLKAKGLLSLVLSLPDDWDYSIEGLATLSCDGKDSVRSALKELEQFGYLRRERLRNKGKMGGTEYQVFEKPMSEKPTSEKPTLEKPILEKPTQLNTKELNTKELNTNLIKSEVESLPENLQEAVNDFSDMRKKIKAPMTDKALSLLLKKLNALSGGDVEKSIAILNQSTERSWRGIFPISEPKNNSGRNEVLDLLEKGEL